MAKVRTSGRKVKKKVWVKIFAPRIFNNKMIGETLVVEPKLALGKTISSNLMDLMGEMKRQNMQVSFKINKVTDSRAETEIIGFRINPAATKRMVRRGKNKVDQSFIIKTSDNKKVRIKPLILTRSHTSMPTLTGIRKKVIEVMKQEAEKLTFESLIQQIVGKRMQMSTKKVVSKIYPVRTFEIRSVILIQEKTNKKSVEVKKEVTKEEKKEVKEVTKEEAEEKKEEIKPAEKKG